MSNKQTMQLIFQNELVSFLLRVKTAKNKLSRWFFNDTDQNLNPSNFLFPDLSKTSCDKTMQLHPNKAIVKNITDVAIFQ